MSALEVVVRPSLARIVAPGDGYAPDRDQYWGSGFFVAPGWLLTCAHVVGKGGAAVWRREGAVGIEWQGGRTTGDVVLAKPRPTPEEARDRWAFPDIALVRVHGADHARCVWLSDRAPTIPAPVSLHGWSRQTGDFGVRHGIGEARAVDGDALLLSDSLPVDGVSGGPVIDRRYGAVIGMNKGRGRHEGAAVPITALRELFDVRGGEVLHTVMREHDLHHLRLFTDASADTDAEADWTRTQSGLPGSDASGLTPALRVHLYGHFAHLPPPRGSGEIMHLVREVQDRVLQEQHPSLLVHDPRTWREGAGLLHGLRVRHEAGGGSRHDLNAVLLYAAKVADHTARTRAPEFDPERLSAFAAWITEQAAEHAYRATIRREIRQLLDGLFDTGRPSLTPTRSRTDVLVRVERPMYGDRYPWSVQLLYDGRDVTPVAGDDRGVPLSRLSDVLREPLARALGQGDHGEHLAAVEVFLPRRLFDLDVDDWTLTPESGDPDDDPDFFDEQSVPLGLRRTVVIRDLQSNSRPPTPEWRRRWNGVTRGPLTAVPLRAEADPEDGHVPGVRRESRLAAFGRLSAVDDTSVPVYCGPVGSGDGHEAMAAALAAGHHLVLWRRDGHDHDECRAVHRQVARVLQLAGRAEGLHRQVRELRIRVADPDTAGAEGLAGKVAILFDPPDRPPFGTGPVHPPSLAATDP